MSVTTSPTTTTTKSNPTPAPDAVGFRAQISGASLWDLVQMECLSRSRQVIRIGGEGGVGYLYFADGRVVHAVTSKLVGEAAALEILSWTHGLFQPCERAWPATGSIETSCEGLILRLAKRRDEAASNLVAFPARAATPAAGGAVVVATGGGGHDFEEIEIEPLHEEGEMRVPNNTDQPSAPTAIGSARPDLTADFPVMLRLGSGGAIVKSKGASEEMAGVVAYAHRLAQLAGELLGLQPFVAAECTFADGRLLIFDEDNGDTVALRPRPDSNLQPLRDRLGL
jgi:hypothetical protein